MVSQITIGFLNVLHHAYVSQSPKRCRESFLFLLSLFSCRILVFIRAHLTFERTLTKSFILIYSETNSSKNQKTKGRVNCSNYGRVQRSGRGSQAGARAGSPAGSRAGSRAWRTRIRSWPGRHPHPTASRDPSFYTPGVSTALSSFF